jgi:hypothetical protein
LAEYIDIRVLTHKIAMLNAVQTQREFELLMYRVFQRTGQHVKAILKTKIQREYKAKLTRIGETYKPIDDNRGLSRFDSELLHSNQRHARRTGGCLAALAQLKDNHKEKVKEYIRKLKAAEQIVNGIGNPLIRTFVTMMYIENLSAKTVRSVLNMSEWGGSNGQEQLWSRRRIWGTRCGGKGIFLFAKTKYDVYNPITFSML